MQVFSNCVQTKCFNVHKYFEEYVQQTVLLLLYHYFVLLSQPVKLFIQANEHRAIMDTARSDFIFLRLLESFDNMINFEC